MVFVYKYYLIGISTMRDPQQAINLVGSVVNT